MQLVDVRKNWQIPLTHDLLGKWQSMAVPGQRCTPILRGAYRNDPSPMQIVSGPYRREKVHYEAPPAIQVPDEMVRLIDWYNQASPLNGDKTISRIARSGIADRAINAQEIAREEVNFILAKTHFYKVYGNQLNDRQARMVSRVFAEGRKGFEGGITTRK